MVRLYQPDVLNDKCDWREQLVRLIQDDSEQFSYVTTDNALVMSTYADYATKVSAYK